jgi:hypothetical protein
MKETTHDRCVTERAHPERGAPMELEQLAADIGDTLAAVDASRVPFKQFQPGVGPYGEPQLVRLIASGLNSLPQYAGLVETKRTPDLLVRGVWALEFKIARPFGDNAALAENWSVNLLHPYRGNVSALGDCLKLAELTGPERRASVVIGYEHHQAIVSLDPLVAAFELIAKEVMHVKLGSRVEIVRSGLIHPVHQRARVFAWEVLRA